LSETANPAILAAVNPRIPIFAVILAAGLGLFASAGGLADDSAASIAAGGLVARRETRVMMAREALRISPEKVVVDYDFRNDTDQDVTTEVAFPVPPYDWGPDGRAVNEASFSDFELYVDGRRAAFETEAKAALNGKDVTAILTSDKIDIPTFGHVRETDDRNASIRTPDLERLPKAEQDRLVSLGLFEPDGTDRWGLWTVQLQFHWTQTFKAHSTIHVRHEYTPVEGFEMMPLGTLRNALDKTEAAGSEKDGGFQREDLATLKGFCPDPPFLRASIRAIENGDPGNGEFVYPQWVDFILTSANTWKQPIEDFTLIVERGKGRDDFGPRMISFCSPQNATVEKLDADHFQVHLTNFVPASELRIGFFDMPKARPAQAK
jgi:uncharacterized protein DUF4424